MDLVTIDHASGGFKFLPSTSAYSTGVAVSDDFGITKLTDSIASKIPAILRGGYATWLMRPPVNEVEFEMDCLRYSNWTRI